MVKYIRSDSHYLIRTVYTANSYHTLKYVMEYLR